LAYDKSVEDRLRHYPHWLASRNLANEASDESVTALINAVRARYDIPQRWYRLKAKLLGVQRIADYDRAAPVLGEDLSFSYREARELVRDTYAEFSPQAGESTRRFSDESWIDAPVRPHKRGGASASASRRMAMTRFAHLGHAGRRSDGEPSVARIHDLWVASQTELFGDSVRITDGYRMWWSYVPPVINTPGYVDAYAYGQLL